MLCTPHNKHQPQMPGGRIRDRATKHPGAGCLLSQEQGKKGVKSPFIACLHLLGGKSRLPRVLPGSHPWRCLPPLSLRRRVRLSLPALGAIPGKILGQSSPAVPRKRPPGVGDTVSEGREAAPGCPRGAGRAPSQQGRSGPSPPCLRSMFNRPGRK